MAKLAGDSKQVIMTLQTQHGKYGPAPSPQASSHRQHARLTLQSQDMRRLLFISKSATAPSTRYRIMQYLPLAQKAGWETEHHDWPSGLIAQSRIIKAARKADVTIVLRSTLHPLARHLLRKASRRLVFDMDDAVFLTPPGKKKSSRPARFAAIARLCDEIWAGNSYLAEHAQQYNDSVHILPTSIDPTRYLCEASPDPNCHDLVWVGSSATKKYLEGALPMLEAVAKEVPGVRLKIISDFQLQGGLPIVNIPWTADGEMQHIASSAIGIAPMPDDPWTRGKCGCKVLQYMAAGLPVVVSDMPTHQRIVTNDQEGYLASTTDEWVAAIKRLIYNPTLRKRLGVAGREKLVREFSLESTWQTMHKRLTHLVEQSPARP